MQSSPRRATTEQAPRSGARSEPEANGVRKDGFGEPRAQRGGAERSSGRPRAQ
jgi:hypothetical protein